MVVSSTIILLVVLTVFWITAASSISAAVAGDERWSAHHVPYTNERSYLYTPGQAGKRGRVACYFTNWAVRRVGNTSYSVEDIPYEKCTHLIYAFVGLSNATWEVKVLEPKIDIENGTFAKFVALREKRPQLSLGVAVGGWAEGGLKFSQMVNDPRNRCNFTRSVTDFMILYGFDSFDLDWEYPGAQERDGKPSDKLAFLQLVRELRVSFDLVNPLLEITMAAPIAEITVDAGYYVSDLCETLNAVHLMAYDLRTVGSIGKHTYVTADSHTPLYRRPTDTGILENINVHDGVKLWMNRGCSRDKIVVGTAFYGRSFNLSDPNITKPGVAPIDPENGQGDPAEYTNEAGYIAYFEICERLGRNATGEIWSKGYDEIGTVPYAYLRNNWIGYEDADSLQIKMDWIKKEGLAGAMNWAIDLDDWRGFCGERDVLIDVLNNSMENYTVPVSPPGKYVKKQDRAPAAVTVSKLPLFCRD